MPDELRIRELLEEILDSNRTPEDVCADEPQLLEEIRSRWDRMRRIGRQIDALFPPDSAASFAGRAALNREVELPSIDGYDLESILGRGGMGVVFRARHQSLSRVVALKMTIAGVYAAPHERERFQR